MPEAMAGNRGEVRVRREEGGSLLGVLLRQDGTGDVDQSAAGPDELRSLIEQCLLLRNPRRDLLGGQLPFGIGATTPGARSGTRRVDNDAVEAAEERVESVRGRWYDLGIADTTALEALVDRRQPGPITIVGEDLALVLHLGGHGEGLAAGTGAKVEHLLTGLRPRQQRRELAALVLHLEPALEPRLVGLDIRRAAVRPTGRDAKADRRDRGGFGMETLQRLQDPRRIRFERVDPQVEGWPRRQRRGLGNPVRAEAAGEKRRRPFRDVG